MDVPQFPSPLDQGLWSDNRLNGKVQGQMDSDMGAERLRVAQEQGGIFHVLENINGQQNVVEGLGLDDVRKMELDTWMGLQIGEINRLGGNIPAVKLGAREFLRQGAEDTSGTAANLADRVWSDLPFLEQIKDPGRLEGRVLLMPGRIMLEVLPVLVHLALDAAAGGNL